MATPDDELRLDQAVRSAYRGPLSGAGAAEARAIARVSAPAPRGLRWWFAAGVFQIRPALAAGVLFAALVAGIGIGGRLRVRPAPRVPTPAGERVTASVMEAPTTFVLRAPGASRVSVAGDFNNWDAEATPMRHSGSGDLWIVSVSLPRGVHLYSFVLDGAEWRPDPAAPLAAETSFGGHNSVVVVAGAKDL